MDKEQMIHELALRCVIIRRDPEDGKVITEQIAKEYLENAMIIRRVFEQPRR